ncbi:MAG TPA: Dabb family protein [Luteolibacter sp.]
MKAFLVSLASVALVSCASISPAPKSGSVDHVVLIWLKRPGNAADRVKLQQTAEELRAIPQVKSISHGTALASERPIVDDSFDVGFVMRFDSPADLHVYETHPLHVAKVNQVLKPLTKKIVVYDIVR